MISKIKGLFRGLFGGQGLRADSVRSGSWTLFSVGVENGLRLVSNLILTRLLAPEIFGLMSLASVFMNGIALMSDIGTRHSVIRSKRGEDPEFLRTAWTIQVLRGVFVAAVACLLAWPAARFYDQPVLFAVICALSATSIFAGFNSIQMAVTSRKMQLARQSLIKIAAQVAMIVTMVGMAVLLESVWALVIGSLVGSVLTLLLSFLALPRFSHGVRFDSDAVREIITFGRWVLLGTMFTYFAGRGIPAVHGALVTLEILGILAISTVWINALENIVRRVQSAVGFPAFSRVLRDRPEDLPRIFARMRLLLVVTSVAMFIGVSWFSQALIDFLYDPRYALAGSFLALQALNGALRILSLPYQNVMLAAGESRLHALVMFVSAVTTIGGTIAGFYIADFFGMIAGMGVGAVLTFVVSAGFAVKRGYANLALDIAMVAGLTVFYVYTFVTLTAA